MARPKIALALVLDVSEPNGCDGLLARARELTQGYLSNVLREGKAGDEVALIACGTDESDNDEYREYGGCENIVVVQDIGACRVETLSLASNDPFLTASSQPKGDLGSAIRVARQIIMKRTKKNKYARKIVVMTSKDSADLETLKSSIDEINACPELKMDFVQLDAEGNEIAGDETELKSFVASMPNICTLLTPSKARADLCKEHVGSKGQVAAYRGPLNILNQSAGFHVQAFTKTRPESAPTLKKVSKIVTEQDKDAVTNVNKAQVSRQISYTLPDDPDTDVSPDHIAEGYRYGREVVPISGHDAEMAIYETKKELSVLGYLRQEKVPLWMNMGSVYIIEAMPGQPNSNLGFEAWVEALLEMKRVAIARFVPRERGNMVIVALIPYKDEMEGYTCLFTRELPFEQDTREFSFGTIKLPSLTPSSEQLAAVDDLVTKMDLSSNVKLEGESSHGLKRELFRPEDTLNPFLERLYKLLYERSKAPDSALPQEDPEVTKLYKPDAQILEACQPQIDKVKALFQLEHLDEGGSKSKRARLGDSISGGTVEATLSAPPEPAAIGMVTDTNVGTSSGDWFSSKDLVDQVGSVNPENDYNHMLDRKDKDLSIPAFRGMVGQIETLLGPDGGEEFYPKAVQCMLTLRKGSLRASTEEEFNLFLRSTKSTAPQDLWKRIVDAELTLISSDDSVAVDDVSPKDALEFLQEAKAAETGTDNLHAPAPAATTDDADFDDFD